MNQTFPSSTRRHRRWLPALGAAALAGTLLAGCGNDDAEPMPMEEPAGEAPMEQAPGTSRGDAMQEDAPMQDQEASEPLSDDTRGGMESQASTVEDDDQGGGL